jgi:hypothetical protein
MMGIKLQAKKELRIVPVRFTRATSGAPDAKYPDIDNRGHNHTVPTVNGLAESGPLPGAVVGIGKQQEVTIQMIRDGIDNSADLFVTSSDHEAIQIIEPKDGEKCENAKHCNITLTGGNISGATPKSAAVQIRFGAKDGPIIAILTTYTFPKLTIKIQPHVVTIDDPSGSGGITPTLKIDDVMTQVAAIWASSGIEFVVQKTQAFNIKLAQANKMLFNEINDVFAAKWIPDTINVYIMQELENALGYGLSKAAYASFGLTRPGVFMGMKTDTTDRTSEVYWCANDLAHELGHFFTLWHPSDKPSSGASSWERHETWSMRFLMHNYNFTGRASAPQDGANWPDFNDFGYGAFGANPYRAGLISLKNVRTSAGVGRDAQCSTVRNYIAQGPSVLY